MTRLALLVACVALLAILPYGSAGPACAKKYWQQQQCVEKCKAKWGYPGSMMGTDRWGSVMQKTDTSTEAWNAALAKACGVETPVGVTGAQGKVAGHTSSSSTTSSSITSTSFTASSSFIQSTSTSSQIILSTNFSVASFLPTTLRLSTSTTSSSTSSETTTSTAQESTSPPPPPSTTSSSSSETPTSTEQESTSEPPTSPTTTSEIPPPPSPPTTTSATAAPTQDSGNDSSGNSGNGVTSNGDIEQYLAAHNSVRAQHGAQPLTWSDEAASKAQQWANNCKFEHSGGSLGPLGENLAAGTSDSYSISRAVKGWTDEVSDYDSNNPKASHFTQVVWKATTQVGCALASCDGLLQGFGKARYYVCEYTPQGNVGGRFAANVQA
uniref:Pathogenesis-related protein 1 n=1 Tax=Moniliophthora perniciosa TaxID=153609 RepID=A0A8E6Y855_MONPR|nr:pathogenesis-related protein 1 [Moniliophthora perniciosa]